MLYDYIIRLNKLNKGHFGPFSHMLVFFLRATRIIDSFSFFFPILYLAVNLFKKLYHLKKVLFISMKIPQCIIIHKINT